VNLTDGWTEYYRPQGEYREDSTHEDVVLLLEARRPTNVDTFLEHELQVSPAEKVHVSIFVNFDITAGPVWLLLISGTVWPLSW
jgi:hypothetical protein